MLNAILEKPRGTKEAETENAALCLSWRAFLNFRLSLCLSVCVYLCVPQQGTVLSALRQSLRLCVYVCVCIQWAARMHPKCSNCCWHDSSSQKELFLAVRCCYCCRLNARHLFVNGTQRIHRRLASRQKDRQTVRRTDRMLHSASSWNAALNGKDYGTELEQPPKRQVDNNP